MLNRKKLREKGKLSFSSYFKTFKEGERVALVRDNGLPREFPSRMQGRTGVVIGKRGSSYVVRVADLGLDKQFIVRPVHLKRLSPTE